MSSRAPASSESISNIVSVALAIFNIIKVNNNQQLNTHPVALTNLAELQVFIAKSSWHQRCLACPVLQISQLSQRKNSDFCKSKVIKIFVTAASNISPLQEGYIAFSQEDSILPKLLKAEISSELLRQQKGHVIVISTSQFIPR